MEKKVTITILLLFILTQFVSPVQGIISMASEENSSFFTVNTEEINKDKASFKIKIDKQVEYDSFDINIPKDSNYNQEELFKEFETDDISFDIKENKLTFKKTKVSQFSLELSNLEQKKNKLTFTSYKGNKKIDKYTHDFELDKEIKSSTVSDTSIDTSSMILSESSSPSFIEESSAMIPEEITIEENMNEVDTSESIDSFSLVPSLETNKIAPRAAISNRAAPTAPNLQRDIKIVPISKTVDAGNDALFKMILKVTGSQVEYKNVKLNIQLPTYDKTNFTQALSELKIAGVTPTYNKNQKRLEYTFATLKSGQTYENVIKVGTTNGEIPNNRDITVKASMVFPKEYSKHDQENSGIVTIKASGEITVEKESTRITDANERLAIATPNGFVQWRVKVVVPKKNTGQLYLKPGSNIVVKDILPSGLTYLGNKLVTGTPKAAQNGQTLTWTFKAPTIAEQKNAKNNLYEQTLVFWTRINNNNNLVGKTLTNNVRTGNAFVGMDFKEPSSTAKSSLKVFANNANSGEISGNVIVPIHIGPLNGSANIGNVDNKNPNPIVKNTGKLRFAHQVAPGYYNKNHNLDELEVIYNIDNNLFLESLKLPESDQWKMGRTVAESQKDIPLPVPVKYDIQLTFFRNGTKLTRTIKAPKEGETYSLTDLGLQSTDRVKEVRYIFNKVIPKGIMTNALFLYDFTIKPNYTGNVKNTFNMVGKSTYNPSLQGNYSNGVQYPFNYRKQFKELYEGKTDLSGDRTARIIASNNNGTPTTRISIELKNHNSGVVQKGGNRVLIKLINMNSSDTTLNSKLESVILLPPNVKLGANPNASYTKQSGVSTDAKGSYTVLNNNYNNSGRQLIKVVWNENYIRPSEQLEAELNVTIGKSAPTDLYFDVYGFSGNNNLKVPTGEANNIRKTIKQDDTDDLNKDGNKSRPRIKSGNRYTLIGEYDLKTEKFVKGPSDTAWKKLTKTTPGGKVDYKLHLDNVSGKDLSSMTLIDVLPSGGDLGITDNISRGSQFTPRLTGPIKLPEAWKGKVNVFYSTSKKPKRDDLIRHTDYAPGTTKLGNPSGAENPNWQTQANVKNWSDIHSFKIELLPGNTWIKGQKIDITFNMTTPTVAQASNKAIFDPKVNKEERAAWNSFAVATDKGQPVEPERVGVYMDEHIGSLTINKVDADNNKVLSGAKFELKKSDGTLTYSLTTNDKGVATLDKIPLGKYELKEVKAPSGYELLDKSVDVMITNSNYKITKTIKNSKQKGSITIKKVDSKDNKILPGAKFEIKKENGTLVDTITTNNQGIAKLGNLDLGKYTIKEVTSPTGYELSKEAIPFEITGNNLVIEKTVKNDRQKGNLVIKKVDSDTNKTLENAEFQIIDSTGKIINTVKTDNTGVVKVDNLDFGTYTIKEIKAPYGYQLLDTPISFEISATQLSIEKTIKNSKKHDGDLIIKKLDGKTGKVLPNAEFEIVSEDGKTKHTIKSNKDGIAELKNLPFGKYAVKEITAPDGYALLQKSLFFEVNDKNTLVELTIKNFEKAPPLPSTGGIGTLIFYAIGGSIMLGGGWMLLTSKRRESK
ncbi:hypothetical protein BW731_03815 [Vagococcus martis]|uniref:Gram-positive cocci surface proteins LPxTG domain-containing protein n=1 Tax=Vagococcus martis TaxID=1768210 RepID=A0A1V4DG06_9ENTE|nr:SpaA isopeptide-forming pilin-related protein [Vagococcus martis]OPF87393.1 hypothetical protein BW731_03815 [Vagococcus martis]